MELRKNSNRFPFKDLKPETAGIGPMGKDYYPVGIDIQCVSVWTALSLLRIKFSGEFM
jgi:hypothetical protein